MKLSEANKKYEVIMKANEPQHIKNRKLSRLMTDMEKAFTIPALRNKEWESENRKVIALYRKIARSRVW